MPSQVKRREIGGGARIAVSGDSPGEETEMNALDERNLEELSPLETYEGSRREAVCAWSSPEEPTVIMPPEILARLQAELREQMRQDPHTRPTLPSVQPVRAR